MSILPRYSLWLAVTLAATIASSAPIQPTTVSPGAAGGERIAPSGCPTFSWSGPRGDDLGLELAVYRLTDDGGLTAKPELTMLLPSGSSSWTPSADRCLSAGRYAWTVRTVHGEWAAPRFFRVERAGGTELERTVERVLERWAAAGRLGPTAGGASSPAPRTGKDGPLSVVAAPTLYDPPDCTGAQMFSDVPNADPRCEFIEQIANDQLATGCSTGLFCPDDPVTRGQLAIYLVRALRGTAAWDAEPNVTRAISVPLTAFLDCESPGGYLDYVDEATGSVPSFLHTGSAQGPIIAFDADLDQEDDQHDICTRLMVPPDYVAGSNLTFAARAASFTPSLPQESLQPQITLDDGAEATCTAPLPNVAGISLVTCTLSGFDVQPGNSLNLKINAASVCCAGPMNDGLELHAVELRYTSTQ